MTQSDPNTPGDSNPATNPAGDGVVITEKAASQGRTGVRTFAILVVSLILVVLALFGLFGLHAGRLSDKGPGGAGQSGADNHAEAAIFNAPEPSPKQAPPGAPSTTGQTADTSTTTAGS